MKEEKNKMYCLDYLLDYELFTEDELILVRKGWGRNKDTYDRICQVRYGMDIDQLAEEDEVELLDYPCVEH